jgi:transcriptional regulator with XRE-family HTH domain
MSFSAPSTAAELARCRAAVRTGSARAARLAAQLSLEELGDSVGVAHSTIFRWENGLSVPHGERALRYLLVLDELLGR